MTEDSLGIDTSDLARKLVGGAAYSAIRLVAVALAGILGTVILARSVGPEAWGTYSAVWSTSLLASAVLVHGVRDRLAALASFAEDWSAAALLTVAAVVFALVMGVALIALDVSGKHVHGNSRWLVLAAMAWLMAYPLRLPAMVRSLRGVRPVRVMVLESIDAVLVPTCAVIALAWVGGVTALTIGIVGSLTVGAFVGMVWGSPFRAGSFAIATVIWRSAADLSAYQLVAAGRELAVPLVLLATGGATVAGAYGLALPLGAMITLALAAAAQPAYAALAAVQNDPVRSAELTNTARRLLGSLVAMLIPAIWLATPTVVQFLFQDKWVFATTTIALVMTAFAVNASIVSWVNVLVLEAGLNRKLFVAQAIATLCTLGAALASDSLGSAGVAAVFLVVQVAFGTWAGRAAASHLPGIQLIDQLTNLVAAGAGVAAVLLLPGGLAVIGMGVPLAVLLLSPTRGSTLAAWRSVRDTLR